MTTAVSNVSTFASQLAVLLVENESVQTDSENQQRDAARATFLRDAASQVSALRDAASAIETGALVSATFTVAGAGCSAWGAVDHYDVETGSATACEARTAAILQPTGKAFSDLAAPMKAIVGDAPSELDNADAKTWETLGEQAKWQAGDASSEVDKINQLSNKLLDLVQSIEQDQHSAANSVIGRI